MFTSCTPLAKQRFCHKNLVGEIAIRSDILDKTIKNDIIENKPKEDKDQALTYETNGDKCTRVSEDMSL